MPTYNRTSLLLCWHKEEPEDQALKDTIPTFSRYRFTLPPDARGVVTRKLYQGADFHVQVT